MMEVIEASNISQKNTSQKITFQKNAFQNVYCAELAFAINYTSQNEHLLEITSTRMNTCLKLHLPD